MRHLGNNWWDRHYRMICWMLVFLLLFLLLHAIGLRITPILRQTARLKATNLVTEQIERQVQESLQKSKGSFAKVERDGEGNILSIGLDVVEANRLRSELAVELVQQLEQMSARQYTVALGSLIGSPLLYARGPRLPFWIAPSGNLRLDFEQTLLSAGINQTVYRVQLRVSAVTQAMLGHADVQTQVETVILLEEQLIAGKVPQVVLSGREEASQRL